MEEEVKKVNNENEENIVVENQEISKDDEKVNDEKINYEEQIAKLNLEINDWKKEYAIKLADFENYKKRKDREQEEFRKYACEPVIVKQLESVDVLSMAIESATSNHDIQVLLDGLNMIKKGMLNNLYDEGLEEIVVNENDKYDPYLHHAVQSLSVEDKENDTILQVFKKGYKLNGKIIRPAMVVVNKK